jgi:hypothetical protein
VTVRFVGADGAVEWEAGLAISGNGKLVVADPESADAVQGYVEVISDMRLAGCLVVRDPVSGDIGAAPLSAVRLRRRY